MINWWKYFWSKDNVWCLDSDSQHIKWKGRLNIFWGIYHLYKNGWYEKGKYYD